MVPLARRTGRGRTRGLAPHGRPGAHPRRRGEARRRRRYSAEAGWPASGGCGERPRPDGRRGGKRGRSPERPNAPAPTARDFAPFSRRTGAERAGARSGRARSQSADWRAARMRAKRPFPPGANGWGEVTRTFGRSARYTARKERRNPHTAFPLLSKRKSTFYHSFTKTERFSCPKNCGTAKAGAGIKMNG